MTAASTTATAPTTAHQRGDTLAGLGAMVRFTLRRDRVKLPAWAGGLGLFGVYVAAAIPSAYPTEDDLGAMTTLFGDPLGRMLTGPGYGFDDPTFERVVGSGYGLYLMLLAALMSILLVTRHTRGEEQTGRAELVRASIVGRHTPLTATLVTAVLTNLAGGIAVWLAMVLVGGFAIAGSTLLAAAVAAVGLAFAGITMVATQLTLYTRAAAGMAGGVLGAAFVVRSGGDMAAEGGTPLSWLSPLGWAQQTGPYVLDRWWPLLLLGALTGITAATGFWLSARRDLAASFVPVRPGPPRARPSLGTPWGLAVRLQRASIIGWTVALSITGMVFGAYADALLGAVEDMPDVFIDLFGAEDLLAGYLGYMAMFMSLFISAFAILAVQSMRSEETGGRGEPVLATPISRWQWLGTNLAVTVVAVVVIAAATGFSTGIGAAVVTGDTIHLGELTLAQLNFIPPVLVTTAVAVLLFGVLPRAIGATWAIVGYAMITGTFGVLLDLPQAAFNLDPFSHIPQMPLEEFAAAPVLILVGLAAAVSALGLVGFRRRPINGS